MFKLTVLLRPSLDRLEVIIDSKDKCDITISCEEIEKQERSLYEKLKEKYESKNQINKSSSCNKDDEKLKEKYESKNQINKSSSCNKDDEIDEYWEMVKNSDRLRY